MTSEIDERTLLANWWEFQRRARGSRDERVALSLDEGTDLGDARDIVDDRMLAGGTEAVELLVALNEAAPAEDGGVSVGCGPLEDLIHEHGDALIDVIDASARQNPDFAKAMSHVWLEPGHLTKETEARLSRWIGARA